MKYWLIAVALLLSSVVSSPKARADEPSGLESATFAGGCFWCTEALFQELRGVKNVTSGLMGGREDGLTEEQIGRGEGGHAEVVLLQFDPKVISYPELLEVFFATHDPTTLNKQGADEGVEYRSAIFYADEDQKSMAESAIAELRRQRIYEKSIVTEVAPVSKFHVAAEKHQDYYSKQTGARYCEMVITPKVETFRRIFTDKLKAAPRL